MFKTCRLTALVVLLAAAAASAAGRYGDNTLQNGNRDSDFAGEYVTALQNDLYQLGYGSYLDGKDETGGVFGASTAAAVKAFQKDYGLAATGVVDAATAAAIEQALAGAPPRVLTSKLTLLETHEIVIKAGEGVGRIKITPQKGVTYVFTGTGECQGCRVLTPLGGYADTKDAPADIVAALRALGDEGKAVTFAEAYHAGAYELEVEPINDLKDVPVTVRIYELAAE